MEASVQEQPFREEPPVHCPLEEELPTKVKCPKDIASGVGEEKGGAQHQLDREREREREKERERDTGREIEPVRETE